MFSCFFKRGTGVGVLWDSSLIGGYIGRGRFDFFRFRWC